MRSLFIIFLLFVGVAKAQQTRDDTTLMALLPIHQQSQGSVLNRLSGSDSAQTSTPRIHLDDSLEASTHLESSTKKKKRNGQLTGNISSISQFGSIPVVTYDSPLPVVLSALEGQLNASIASIPLSLDFRYTLPGNLIGQKNYFSIRLNTQEIKKLQENRRFESAKKLRLRSDSLKKIRLDYIRRIDFIEKQKKVHRLTPNIPSGVTPNLKFPVDSISQTARPKIPALNFPEKDSLHHFDPSTLSIPLDNRDSLIYPGLPDTSFSQLVKLQRRVSILDKEIESANRTIKHIEFPRLNIPRADSGALASRPKFSFLEGVEKFDVGTVYPSYSTFLHNQSVVQGIDTRYKYKALFFCGTAGDVITNAVSERVDDENRLYNFPFRGLLMQDFVFSRSSIVSGMVGLGDLSRSYIAFGSIFSNGRAGEELPAEDKNSVYEINAALSVRKIVFTGAIAQSFPTTGGSETVSFKQLVQSQSYQFNSTTTIPCLKSRVTAGYRRVEPFFRSHGMPYLKSDLERIDLKLVQPVGRRVRLTFQHRSDRNNIRNILTVGTRIHTSTGGLSIRLIKQKTNINVVLTRLVQETNSVDHENSIKNTARGLIKNFIVSRLFVCPQISSTNMLSLSWFDSFGPKHNQFLNHTLSSFNKIERWDLNLSLTYNGQSATDSTEFDQILTGSLANGYQFQNGIRLLSTWKLGKSYSTGKFQTGYGIRVTAAIRKNLVLELAVEKLIIGNYLNAISDYPIERFPYYGRCKLTMAL